MGISHTCSIDPIIIFMTGKCPMSSTLVRAQMVNSETYDNEFKPWYGEFNLKGKTRTFMGGFLHIVEPSGSCGTLRACRNCFSGLLLLLPLLLLGMFCGAAGLGVAFLTGCRGALPASGTICPSPVTRLLFRSVRPVCFGCCLVCPSVRLSVNPKEQIRPGGHKHWLS